MPTPRCSAPATACNAGSISSAPTSVVFATDAPLGPIGKTIAAVEKLGLGADARAKIMSGNAKRLLKLG